MGVGLEVIGVNAVNPGTTTPAAFAAATGDSLAVRAFNDADGAFLENIYAQEATPGIIRVRSARMHDNNQGLRLVVPSSVPRELLPDELSTRIYSTDTLIVEGTGGAAETDVAALLLRYNNLNGIAGNYMRWEEVMPRIDKIMGQEIDVTSSATIGAWGPGSAINTTFDNWQANRSYALLGYTVNVACCAVTVKGIDTGNVRIGGPGSTEPLQTKSYFIGLSKAIGLPAIPVIQANNRGNTLVDLLANAASVAVKVGLTFALLTP